MLAFDIQAEILPKIERKNRNESFIRYIAVELESNVFKIEQNSLQIHLTEMLKFNFDKNLLFVVYLKSTLNKNLLSVWIVNDPKCKG